MTRREHENALRKLRSGSAGTLPLLKQVLAWNRDLKPSSIDDREAVLVSYVLLEQALKMRLILTLGLLNDNRVSRLFDHDGGKPVIFGSAQNRALLLYSLEIISERCLYDIADICIIRNTFAHSPINLRCDNTSVSELSRLRCISALPDQINTIEDGELTVNLATPRARITGFIILFFLNCGENNPGGAHPFSTLFEPFGPFPQKCSIQDLPQFEIGDRIP